MNLRGSTKINRTMQLMLYLIRTFKKTLKEKYLKELSDTKIGIINLNYITRVS